MIPLGHQVSHRSTWVLFSHLFGPETFAMPLPIKPTHYVHRNCGQSVFVKEADFFESQGGLRDEWGKAWTPIVAKDLEHAREIAEKTLPPWKPEPHQPAPTDRPWKEIGANCHACSHSYMEPDDDLTCGHPDAGPVGLYTKHAANVGGHCGPRRPKFKQHPKRNPDGTLKGG